MDSIRIHLALMALIFLVNAGFQSTTGDENPAVNFFGTIQTGIQTDNAQNILIGGNYEHIKLYSAEQSSDDPKANTTEIRLDDVKTIQPKINPSEKKVDIEKFKGIEYVEIIVEFKNNLKKNYVVEKTRKISYEIPLDNGSIKPLSREIRFDALKIMTFKGNKQRSRETQETKNQTDQSSAKKALCTQAKQGIESIEHTATNIEKHLEKTKEAVYYLCG